MVPLAGCKRGPAASDDAAQPVAVAGLPAQSGEFEQRLAAGARWAAPPTSRAELVATFSGSGGALVQRRLARVDRPIGSQATRWAGALRLPHGGSPGGNQADPATAGVPQSSDSADGNEDLTAAAATAAGSPPSSPTTHNLRSAPAPGSRLPAPVSPVVP